MLSALIARLRTFDAAHPKVASGIRHFVFAALAVFLVAVLPVFQDIGAGHPISVDAAKAAVIAGAVGVLALAGRTVAGYIGDWVGQNPPVQ